MNAIKATIEVQLKPFTVPNFVSVNHAVLNGESHEVKQFALSELSPETLEALCDEFTSAVFKKAGKQRPPINACGVDKA